MHLTQTNKTVVLPGEKKKRRIYIGPRGGQYIKKDNKFIALSSTMARQNGGNDEYVYTLNYIYYRRDNGMVDKKLVVYSNVRYTNIQNITKTGQTFEYVKDNGDKEYYDIYTGEYLYSAGSKQELQTIMFIRGINLNVCAACLDQYFYMSQLCLSNEYNQQRSPNSR